MKTAFLVLAIAAHTQVYADCDKQVDSLFQAYKQAAVAQYPNVKALQNASITTGNIAETTFGNVKLSNAPRITINSNICDKPVVFMESVIAHELGHIIANHTYASHGESTADRYAGTILEFDKKLTLIDYLKETCVAGDKYYCERADRWKIAFNLL